MGKKESMPGDICNYNLLQIVKVVRQLSGIFAFLGSHSL